MFIIRCIGLLYTRLIKLLVYPGRTRVNISWALKRVVTYKGVINMGGVGLEHINKKKKYPDIPVTDNNRHNNNRITII